MTAAPGVPPGPGRAGARGRRGLTIGGRPVPMGGEPLLIHEQTPLDFHLPPEMAARLYLAGMPVPMVDGRADRTWIDESRKDMWVGELDLAVVPEPDPGPGPGRDRLFRGGVLRPKVVVLPQRTTLEGFGFLVEQFRSWAGAGTLVDPAGRARIWAELAPRVPTRDEERALVALALLRKGLPAFAALHRAPATTPTSRLEWSALDRTGGRRVMLRRLHRFDPPRPPGAPREGRVATLAVEHSPDREENRFVVAVVRRLLAMAREAVEAGPEAGVDADLARELAAASRALAGLAAEPPWSALPPGPAPRVSFLLRDQPHYRTFRAVAEALDASLRFSPLPGDPVALGVRTQTLNALFEVWVSQAVRASVRRRLGLPAAPGAPLPRGGAEEADTGRGRVRICFDRVYPRSGRDDIVALSRKRSPDASVEWWPAGGRPVAMAVDATWSRNPTYHDDKLGYGRSLAYGDRDDMLGAPRLVARRSAVVFPGPKPGVVELGFALSLATVSAPPSAEGWAVLADFLDRALEGVIPAGLTSPGGFRELAELRAR